MLLVLAHYSSAQTFTEAPQSPPFIAVWASSIAFSDVDGDGDKDVLIAGMTDGFGGSERITKLYTNDGMGMFSEIATSPFDSVSDGSIAFSDVDGDGDEDVLITGDSHSPDHISRLYINDGMGNFSEKAGTPFDGVKHSAIAFSDVDGDDDEDVLITGEVSSVSRISKLYLNDGAGNFTEQTGSPFEAVRHSSVAFADVDKDGDVDVLISGTIDAFGIDFMSKLYINDGMGNFSEQIGQAFEGVWVGSVAFSDVDGDGDQDLLITGGGSSGGRIARLYINDGTGNFSEQTGSSLEGVWVSSLAFSDVDQDGDPDVLITGENSSGEATSILYANDGVGNFSEVSGSPFEGVSRGSIAFADVDGDGAKDVLITGTKDAFGNQPVSTLFTNDGMASSIRDFKERTWIDMMPYPNPTTSNNFFLTYNSEVNGIVTMTIYDLKGHSLYQKKEFAETGRQTMSIEIPNIPRGQYIIELDNGTRKGVTKITFQ